MIHFKFVALNNGRLEYIGESILLTYGMGTYHIDLYLDNWAIIISKILIHDKNKNVC